MNQPRGVDEQQQMLHILRKNREKVLSEGFIFPRFRIKYLKN